MWNDIVASWQDAPAMVRLVRIVLAAIWVTFGLLFKVADLVPRHKAILGRVVGARAAGWLIVGIGLAEVALGAWVLSGLYPLVCMACMTGAIAAMNAIELWRASDLLLAPVPMVLGNVALLTVGWWAALQ